MLILFVIKDSVFIFFKHVVCKLSRNKRVMLDIPSQYMHYCLVILCYCVSDKDHCCVLCYVTRDLLFTWYIVHQPNKPSRVILVGVVATS